MQRAGRGRGGLATRLGLWLKKAGLPLWAYLGQIHGGTGPCVCSVRGLSGAAAAGSDHTHLHSHSPTQERAPRVRPHPPTHTHILVLLHTFAHTFTHTHALAPGEGDWRSLSQLAIRASVTETPTFTYSIRLHPAPTCLPGRELSLCVFQARQVGSLRTDLQDG